MTMALPGTFNITRRGAIGIAGAALATVAMNDFPKARAAPALLTAWADGWSSLGEPQKLIGLFDAQAVYEDVAFGDVVEGTQALGALLANAHTAIPDFRTQIFDGFTTDGMAAVEYEIVGTQTGDLPYLPATGKSFRIRASSILALRAGKIMRESRYYDMARFLLQLGVLQPTELPALGTPARKPGGAP
jgi:steroid delta-isomerase-like uncharacterized protein